MTDPDIISTLTACCGATSLCAVLAIHCRYKLAAAQQQLRTAHIHSLLEIAQSTGHGETAEHLHRVAAYAVLIAKHLQWSPSDLEKLHTAALLHDIGKVAVPLQILHAPRKLTPEEFDIIKAHTHLGAQILGTAQTTHLCPHLQWARVVALTHHEKWDGTGYPQNLTATHIPEIGRIVAIADCFDALTFERPYKKAWTFEQTISYLQDQAGKAFDPNLIRLVLQQQDQLRQLHLSYTAHPKLSTPPYVYDLQLA